MNQFFVQAAGFAAMAFCIGCYQVKDGRGLTLCKTAGDLIYVLHFLMLGAYSGCVTLGASAVNQIVYSFQGRCKWAGWKGWRWLFTGLLIAGCLIVWRNHFQPVPCVCAMISMGSVTLTTWTGDPKVMRLNKLLIAGPTWIFYSAVAGSWSGILCESVGMVSAALAVFRYRRQAAGVKNESIQRRGQHGNVR